MSLISPLPEPIDGLTHYEEGQMVLRRDAADPELVSSRLEIRGGIMVDDAFVPEYPSGRSTSWEEVLSDDWTPAQRAEFEDFQKEFEADPSQPERRLLPRAIACLLAFQLSRL
jgi:hypothetical protein